MTNESGQAASCRRSMETGGRRVGDREMSCGEGVPVALLVASFPDSILRFRGHLIEKLQESGLAVHVGSPGLDSHSDIGQALACRSVTCHSLPLQRNGTSLSSDLHVLSRLWLLCRGIKPDLIIAYTIKPVIYGMLAAWLAGVPHRFALITGLGYAFTGERKGPVKRLIMVLYRLALARTHKVFFQNPDDERLFRQLGILSAGTPSVVVSGSGVDVGDYPLTSMPAGPLVFLMIGRLLGDKGVREYAAAARRIRARQPGVRFVLAGWIDSNPDAIAQSELDAWVADGTLEFLGKLSDVRPAIAASAVYVLPSYREGTPRTVLEAMAMGRPIITTDAPGCRETVIDGENGWLVPVKSVDGLVAAMQRFIDDPLAASRMGRESRRIAEEKYDVHKVNAVMLREMGIAQPQSSGGTPA